jgi:antitoxin CptB
MKNQELINMLIYRSWHRGSKETDILLGDFAKSQINNLTEAELSIYTDLVEEDDWDIYNWVLNEEGVIPDRYLHLIIRIRNFNILKNK